MRIRGAGPERRRARAGLALGLLCACGTVLSGCGPPGPGPLRIGAVFPTRGPQITVAGAREERLGVEIARDFVNAAGGVAGRRIELDEHELSTIDDAAPALDALQGDGVEAVVGAYSSSLSLRASDEAARRGIVYWEAGAVADRLTGRGLPLVFRVGADGRRLGDNSARFAAAELAARLGKPVDALRLSLVVAADAYARSVADAAAATAREAGMTVVSRSDYDPYAPRFEAAVATLREQAPDIVVLASHVPDGVAFRRAFLAAGLRTGAFIGSTMAECGPDFGNALGADAVGVFASDRPGRGFDPGALGGPARALYERLAVEWSRRARGAPTEDGLAGFSAAWTLFHDVLPRARGTGAGGHATGAEAIAAAARALDLPAGSLPDGSGVRFSSSPERLGQNLRAAAVVWQWQAPRHSVVVYPAEYRTGAVNFVPLPR